MSKENPDAVPIDPPRCRVTMTRPARVRARLPLAWVILCSWAVAASPGESTAGADNIGVPEMLLRVKPAVVLVLTEVSGEVRLACPNGPLQRVTPAPIREHGSGFLITPDGYVVTNAHVVQAYHESGDAEARDALLRDAIRHACVLGQPGEEAARRSVAGLLPRIAPTASVNLKKSLRVVLSNRDTFVAEVKAYSPPLEERPGKQRPAQEAGMRESGKDVAILKIDARNLPTLSLGDSDRVQVGQAIHLVGYPGVVQYHELLDRRRGVEASATSGQISGVQRDARGAPVIQTDAAASWGNSGGPGVNAQGNVIGILTFISLTPDESQAVQGFNFLVPANIVREFARAAGAQDGAPSPFNAVWHDAVARFTRGDWKGAQTKLEAAARLVPDLPDVRRLQAETEIRRLQPRGWPSPLALGASAAAALIAAGGAAWWWRRRGRAGRAAGGRAAREAEGEDDLPVVRVSAGDLGRALAQRPDLVVVDVRDPAAYARSAVQVRGAIRAQPADVLSAVSTLPRDRGLVLYCASPDEAASVEAARRLLTSGYRRVAVLAGGFAAWEAASLPLERTPHGRATAGAVPAPTLPAPVAGNTLDADLDGELPVGMKGEGPYFNASASRIGARGVSLRSPRPLTVGQVLRLVLFLPGDPLEVSGRVVSVTPGPVGDVYGAEVAFESLDQDQEVALEGFILGRRTAGRPALGAPRRSAQGC